MTSLKDRQRAAARAKLEREMASRMEQAARRRQRRIWAGSIGVAVVVVVGLVVVLVSATGSKPKAKPAAASAGPASCAWTPNPNPSPSPVPSVAPSPDLDLTKTGTPPTTDIPNKGTRNFVLDTNQGNITISLDLAKAPCASASLAYLSDQKFYNKTDCGNLITGGPYLLICGDPTDHGDGGPSYTYTAENLPTDQRPNYSEGTVAMLNNGAGNGSQFMIFYGDTPVQTDPSSGTETPVVPSNYTIVGTVTGGLDIVKKIAAGGAGAQDKYGAYKPKLALNIASTSVGPVNAS